MLTTLTSTILFGCLALSWVYACAFLVLLLENRRYWRVHRLSAAPTLERYPRTCIFVPCKGLEHNLRENLSGFLQQDHPNYEVLFIVENHRDTAIPLIRNLMEESRTVKTRMIYAGIAEDCGQKVHNLRAATRDLAPEIDVLVFADSDACPNPTWLRWLTHRIGRKKLGARTGYRWMLPRNKSIPTLLGVTINNALASILGKGHHYLVWGGSWAIHRQVFEDTGIRQAWLGSLSDDLVASRSLQVSGLDVGFEPQCVCTTRVQFTWSSLFEFLRRQFLIGRRYSPRYLYSALATTAVCQIAFWGGLAYGAYAIANGGVIGYWLVGSSIALYLSSVLRSAIRQNMARGITPEWRQHKRARNFDLVFSPLTGLFTLIVMAASVIGNRISWRGVHYYIGRGGRIQMIGRRIDTENWTIDQPELEENVQFEPTRAVLEANAWRRQAKRFSPKVHNPEETQPQNNRRAA